jgi:NAD-dependent deacetylase
LPGGVTGGAGHGEGMDSDLAVAAELVAAASKVVVLTGAGVSVASGLPTYRGAGGMWTEDPSAERRSTPPPAKMCDPDERRAWWDGVWARWGPMRASVAASGPNAAHRALVDWSAGADRFAVVTQNIDGLHTAAGSSPVVELHGSLWRSRCVKRDCRQPRVEDRVAHDVAPDCPRCGRPMRPDVVLFGERLDRNDVVAAERAVGAAELVVVTGTSGNVYPAAELPKLAAFMGRTVIRVDPGVWEGPEVDWAVEVAAPAEEALPVLAAAATG